jgi:Transglycosylase SLT domain
VRAAFGRRARLLLLLAAALSGIGSGGRSSAGSPIAGGNDVLDRIALAVAGIESSYGSDPAMWRADPGGPQGPMQVSAAAAVEVGGGDRFAAVENRALGRAYLSDLYHRYGNWPDAITAYNWGPGNMDAWIGRGRPPLDMPITVAIYRARVLAAALYGPAGLRVPRYVVDHRQPRRSLADLRHPSQASVAIERLYGVVMRLGAMQSH